MGVYDEVIIDCPSCSEFHMEQTKWGNCSLSCYTIDNAPLAILAGLKEQSDANALVCEHCAASLKLHIEIRPRISVAVSDKPWRTI